MGPAGGRPDFEDFYAAAAARIVRHALALTADMAEAEDVAQEAFARAWQRWPSVSRCDSPEAWVRRVATNLAISRWRRLRVARSAAARSAAASLTGEQLTPAIGPDDQHPPMRDNDPGGRRHGPEPPSARTPDVTRAPRARTEPHHD